MHKNVINIVNMLKCFAECEKSSSETLRSEVPPIHAEMTDNFWGLCEWPFMRLKVRRSTGQENVV